MYPLFHIEDLYWSIQRISLVHYLVCWPTMSEAKRGHCITEHYFRFWAVVSNTDLVKVNTRQTQGGHRGDSKHKVSGNNIFWIFDNKSNIYLSNWSKINHKSHEHPKNLMYRRKSLFKHRKRDVLEFLIAQLYFLDTLAIYHQFLND